VRWVVFRRVLTGVRDRIEGALAVSLIGLDGIAVETVGSDVAVPLEMLGAEFGSFVKSIRHTNTELNTGEVLQFSLVTEKYITFLSEVTPEYYILLVLTPDGNYGRARYELSRAKYLLRDELI
jgi:predicted regulator of Ras-like GTPase activity (Roadblock/LC7/MglB family)